MLQNNYRKIGKKMIMRWTLMWLNWSVATINATFQLLDIYRFTRSNFLLVINENVNVHDFYRNSFCLPVPMWTRNYYFRAYLGQSPIETPKYLLAFSVSLPPLGFNKCTISSAKKPSLLLLLQ